MIDLDIKKRSGSYYTKPEIVNLILDLVGYTTDKPLFNYSLLEPSSGEGAFLIPAIERLLQTVLKYKEKKFFDNDEQAFFLLRNTICSIEIDSDKYQKLTLEICSLLELYGASKCLSQKLVEEWLIETDFLLWNKPIDRRFNFIVGNPPYIRIENMNEYLAKKYRKIYKSLYDRADIYIAFIEHGLEMLSDEGKLNYICTDRFTKNRYGKEIRRYISENFHVEHYLDIHNAQPFTENVSAYPCIFTIGREEKPSTRTLKMNEVNQSHLELARKYLFNDIYENKLNGFETHTITEWFKGSEPWILNGARAQELLYKLENNHPLLTEEPHNVKVGIGVATGANDIYIVNPHDIELEKDILLPIVTKSDIEKGYIEWNGNYVINPYNEDGSLIDLNKYPKLRDYLLEHEVRIKSRSTAKKNPNKWYKTIDRIYPKRLSEPKLLIPDIKKKNLIVLDKGNFYPEHSLYYLTAGTWNIEALQAMLTSSIVKFFIWSYATKMRGDYLRYQAQYLKKIRLPIVTSKEVTDNLINAYQKSDFEAIELITKRLYNLTTVEYQDIKDLVE